MTLKPEHIVEELNRTPKLKRDLIMKMIHDLKVISETRCCTNIIIPYIPKKKSTNSTV